MFRVSRLVVWLAVLGAVTAGTCLAQVGGFHLTLDPYIGYAVWSHRVNLENQLTIGGKLGVWPNKYIGLEGQWAWMGGSKTLNGPRPWREPPLGPVDQDVQSYGADLIFDLFPDNVISPYVCGGWQESKLKKNSGYPNATYLNGPMAALGLKWWAQPRVALTAEVRDFVWKFEPIGSIEPADGQSANNILYSVGVTIALGGTSLVKDTDGDGVPDKRDNCPGTPLGARVDSHGCPIDSDGDGVPDGIDQCADTPRGATVDAKGCPIDSDGDGVFDGIDQCPNTPHGAVVDAKGCPIDSDGDGVPDGIDKCPNTPANAKVDANGCPIEVSEKETELLNTGMIRVSNINFDTGKWTILPESIPVLDQIGNILVQWPELKIEIGGHTDSRGSDKANLELSEKRANAVRDYLLGKFPQIKADQYTAKGYGESKPIASNTTIEGMAKNRRVEFKVLNTEVLKKERESRKILQK